MHDMMNDGLNQNNKENVSSQQAEKTTKRPYEFSCAIIGDKGVGKTSFIMRILTGKSQTVIPDKNYTLQFLTNHGHIKFNVSIMDGRSMQIPKGGFDCGIIMFDATTRSTDKNISNWYNEFTRKCKSGNIPPFVFCGNKIDDINDNSWKHRITFPTKKNLPLLGTSAIWNYNLEYTFLLLGRNLMEDDSLYFVGMPSRVDTKNALTVEVSVPAAASSSSDSPIKNSVLRRLFVGSSKLRGSSSATSNVTDSSNNPFDMNGKKAKEGATSTKSKVETEPGKKSATSKEDEEALAALPTEVPPAPLITRNAVTVSGSALPAASPSSDSPVTKLAAVLAELSLHADVDEEK